ncbi:hypothetical protein GPECTOR_70g509 [Gonium pectorale]|uniref:non-specific serine/threonine protein kinase n=1 Tax=Gonium pectorale TaxID=33097 RepID=A0A150G361_GONPE|nr:hypothetical protein GPECTOR_70g509 [Gonium pectorale]|eukprot:KXZ44278.1 hypothetical protein GPECTOR_70g509 [Gonium pectorale]
MRQAVYVPPHASQLPQAAPEDPALSFALAASAAEQQANSRQNRPASNSAPATKPGQALSHKFWRDQCLGYGEVITDGFYDIYGDYPEICDDNEFPSLDQLRRVRIAEGDVREVVVVDHGLDDGLLKVETRVADKMARANPQDDRSRIKVVAAMVCESLGGTYDQEYTLDLFWHEASDTEKRNNQSAVVPLCSLKVGAARHRALLFKLLADVGGKLQCRLIRGAALCGSDAAANVVVCLEGFEYIVDLVHEPGRLMNMQEFERVKQERRARSDSWRKGGTLVEATSAGGGLVAAVRAGTAPVGSPVGSAPTGTNGSVHGGRSHSARPGVDLVGSAAPATGAQSSPRGLQQRPHALAPSVAAGPTGVYSSSVPSSGVLQGPGAGWALGQGQKEGHSDRSGPAIAGSRVKFIITDKPKGAAAAPVGAAARPGPLAAPGQSGRAPSGAGASAAAPGLSAPAAQQPGTGVSAPPQPPSSGFAAAHAQSAVAVISSRGSGGLPSKARSMLDLGSSQGGSEAGASGGDLIRFDSPPRRTGSAEDSLPEPAPPEPSSTPTGPHPHAAGGNVLLHNRQVSLDQNGWVKFSNSFGRIKEPHALPGPSPLSQQAAGAGAALAAQQLAAAADSSSSLFSRCSATEASRASSASGTTVTNSGPPLPSASSAATTAGGAALAGSGAQGVSGVTAASPFLNFALVPGMSLGLGAQTGSGPPGSTASGPSSGTGLGVSGAGSNPLPGSYPQLPGHQHQPQRQQAPPDARSASPFHAMQLGAAQPHGPSLPPQLASAFAAPGLGSSSHHQHQLPRVASGPNVANGPSQLQAQQPAQATGGAPHHVRSVPALSADSGLPQHMLGNGAAAGPTGGAGQAGLFTPLGKAGDAANGSGGSKAPSPSSSTPFLLGAAAAGGAGVGNSGGNRRDASTAKEGGKRDSQAFFADLSPFNTASGASGGGSGARDSTPPGGHQHGAGGASGSQAHLLQARYTVEVPSSDNSRDTTPRVSQTNVGAAEPPAPQRMAYQRQQTGSSAGLGVEDITPELAAAAAAQWGNAWGLPPHMMGPHMMAAAQQQQYMMQPPFMFPLGPQGHVGGPMGPGAGMGLGGPVSMVSTTTHTVVSTQLIDSGAAVSGPGPRFGAPASGAARPRPALAPSGPQLALPAPHQQRPSDLSHEMTLPSQQRLAAAVAGVAAHGGTGGGGSAGGADAGPLALQPSVSISMPLPSAYRDLEINPEELTFGQRIGFGSYGEVYRGTWRGTEVAIKRLLEQNVCAETIREFRDEVIIMSKLRHPNIVLFMGAVTRPNELAIVTQYVQNGSLYRLLKDPNVHLGPKRRLSMARDIAKGMEYLHNCRPVLVHRDLKSPNLLVDRDWTVKVCDFGLSRLKLNTFLTNKSQGGSPAWMAPEILRNEACDEKSDVFSFGVIMYELVTGREPWESLAPMQVVFAVGNKRERMELPKDLDPAVASLMHACWADDPRERPSFSQILATMAAWEELRPTAAVMQQQQEVGARARRQRGGA